MKIGKIELPLGLMLAPMAGVSDGPSGSFAGRTALSSVLPK